MTLLKNTLILVSALLCGLLLLASPVQAVNNNACGADDRGSLFGILPTWDRGLGDCEDLAGQGSIIDQNKTKIIITNITDILITLAGLIAVGFVIVGGFKYVLSSGNSQQASDARSTIINAAIGVVIVIAGKVIVGAIFNQLTGSPEPELDDHGLVQVDDSTVIDNILNMVWMILGSISLIVIVLQGIKYILSGGNSERTAEARNGIIYALIGLTVALVSWSLLNFGINQVVSDVNLEAQESTTIVSILNNVVRFMTLVGGFIAVIMVLVGGIKYLVSGGNSENAGKARDMIIYALIGVAVMIIASAAISFVLDLVIT